MKIRVSGRQNAEKSRPEVEKKPRQSILRRSFM